MIFYDIKKLNTFTVSEQMQYLQELYKELNLLYEMRNDVQLKKPFVEYGVYANMDIDDKLKHFHIFFGNVGIEYTDEMKILDKYLCLYFNKMQKSDNMKLHKQIKKVNKHIRIFDQFMRNKEN